MVESVIIEYLVAGAPPNEKYLRVSLPTSATMGPPPRHRIQQLQNRTPSLEETDENMQPARNTVSPSPDVASPVIISANMSRDDLYKVSE